MQLVGRMFTMQLVGRPRGSFGPFQKKRGQFMIQTSKLPHSEHEF